MNGRGHEARRCGAPSREPTERRDWRGLGSRRVLNRRWGDVGERVLAAGGVGPLGVGQAAGAAGGARASRATVLATQRTSSPVRLLTQSSTLF